MCIKFAPYLHQNSANRALNIVLFYALVLMLLTKFVLNRTIRRCCFCINFWNFDAELAPNALICTNFLGRNHKLPNHPYYMIINQRHKRCGILNYSYYRIAHQHHKRCGILKSLGLCYFSFSCNDYIHFPSFC